MPTHTHRFHSTAVFWRNDLISTVASRIILVKWVVIVIDNFCINLLSHRLRFSWVWLRYLQILDTGPAWKKLKPFGISKLKKKTRQIRFIFGASMKNVCAHCSTYWYDPMKSDPMNKQSCSINMCGRILLNTNLFQQPHSELQLNELECDLMNDSQRMHARLVNDTWCGYI